MHNDQIVLLTITVVSSLTATVSGCYRDSVSQCPYYTMINQMTIIPTPDPDNLDTVCERSREGLKCLLGPSFLGRCDAVTRTIYSSILNVLQYPCSRLRSDYIRGRACWKSGNFSALIGRCYMLHKKRIDANYCTGQPGFMNCAISGITELDHCGEREQRVLTTMVTRSYNDNGLVMKPPCQEITDLSKEETTTTTTTTTTPATTTATNSPHPHTSSKESSSTAPDEMTTNQSGPESTEKTGKALGRGGTQASRSNAGDRVVSVWSVCIMGVWMSARLL